ncbi:MAG TPA: carbamoyltransferase C-terminal domain-containing protein [Bryobacteraceae bacterium]|nr:carbamoyltransferase C-terminal domain-containing protein [Bryobacteraceae bacterium]
MNILGLGGLLNEAAAAVLVDGNIVSAVEQRKVAPRRHRGPLPLEAIHSALTLAGVEAESIEIVSLARPFVERHDGRHLNQDLRSLFPNARVAGVEHHRAHAASAYFASPFDHATVLTLDNSGDFRCGALWKAAGTSVQLEREFTFPDSLGDLYSRVTELLGFKPSAEEHKVQWLSTSGDDALEPVFRSILMQPGVGLRADRSWFDHNRVGRGGFSARFYSALGLEDGADIPAKMIPSVAAGLQRAVERIVIELAGSGENLCLAGGLGLNALLVDALEECGKWRNVYVQPVSGNAGTALGAVWHAWHRHDGQAERAPLSSLALGPAYGQEAIKKVLENCKLSFKYLLTTDEVVAAAADRLAGDQILAWMQGRMEFGPRALGNRSILASPLNPYSTENLNVYIKHREPFRKFAASVPAERAAEYFVASPNARFLASVGRVRPEHRKTFESAVLGDGLIRVHTVDKDENPLFHRLLTMWGERTGVPVLYNTSFNLFGDPMVCTPRDAVRSFYSSGIDSMVIGNFVLEK